MTPDPPDTAPLLRPAPIAKGDTIGVVAPSYAPRAGWLLRGVKALERAGYTVRARPRDRNAADASRASRMSAAPRTSWACGSTPR